MTETAKYTNDCSQATGHYQMAFILYRNKMAVWKYSDKLYIHLQNIVYQNKVIQSPPRCTSSI